MPCYVFLELAKILEIFQRNWKPAIIMKELPGFSSRLRLITSL